MNSNNQVQTVNSQVALNNDHEALEKFRIALQNFSTKLNTLPTNESIDNTADGKAKTVLISHIEMTLDEMFFGLWETENFKWSVIANEVVGSLDLIVVHPVTGNKLKRTGAASIQIMVDKVPDAIKNNPQEKNRWALSTENKKPNALDMGFPKLKAECLKNAAQSFGKLFGRDLNRAKADVLKPIIKDRWKTQANGTEATANA